MHETQRLGPVEGSDDLEALMHDSRGRAAVSLPGSVKVS